MAANTLWELASCEGGKAALAAGGSVRPLVQLLLAWRGQPISETDMAAAGALGAMAQENPELALEVVNHGGVPALLALIERRSTASAAASDEELALQNAAGTMSWLAYHGGECQAAVVAAGSVRSLASLLSNGNATVQYAAAEALRGMLGACPAAAAAFEEAQAAPAAVRLLSSPSQRLQQHAAGVLGNAAADHAVNSAAILAAGAMQPLVQLLRTPGHSGHKWAAVTVDNLCLMQPEAAAAAIQQADGVLDALCQIAAGSGDNLTLQAAGKAMKNVAYALEVAAKQQAASGSSQHSARPADSAAATDSEAAGPAEQPAAKPARMCAAPGCGATRGLKRCGGCGTVRYCSANCSRAHWREHKAECRRLQAERAAAAAGAAEVPNA